METDYYEMMDVLQESGLTYEEVFEYLWTLEESEIDDD